MSSSVVRRAARTAVAAAACAFALTLLTAEPAAAHSVQGGELPAPPWLLAYGGAFGVVLVALALRSSWARPRKVGASDHAEEAAAPVDAASAPPAIGAGNVIDTIAYVAMIAAAIIGPDSAAANVAPLAVLVGWWIALPILCLAAGDVMSAINPFQIPAALAERFVGRRLRSSAEPPPWMGAALIASFAWFFLAYHTPGSPRALAVYLIAYAVVVVVAALMWGRGWLARREGFAGLSAAVANLSWRSTSRVVPGVAPLMVVWLGTTAFDAVTSTTFWADVVGTSVGWGATAFASIGLLWLVAIVGAAYIGAVKVAGLLGADGEPPLLRPLGLALVPLAAAWFIAHDITLLMAEGQNLIVLLSDPIGRGWDLFGTIDNTVDFGIVEETWVRWLQLGLLAVGHVLTVVIGHDVALRLRARTAAVQVTWCLTALSALSFIAAVMLVMG